MRRSLSLVALLLVVCVLSPLHAQRGRPLKLTGPAYRSGEIVVGYYPGKSAAAQARAQTDFSLQVQRALPRLNAQLMGGSRASRDVYGLARALRKLPGVRYAEPNYLRRVLLDAPNDPGYNDLDTLIAPFDEEATPTWFQWGLHQIKALAAWNIFPGVYYTAASKPSGATKVAVIDTGIDCGGTDGLAHPDFINSGGSSADALLGGQIDFTGSRNVQSGATPTDFADDYGHGTAVAGVIGASTNNGGSAGGQGIAGLGYHCQLMSVKALDGTGSGTEADIANGIIWAVDHGAVVINISAGDIYYSQLEQDAVDYAWERGSLVVVAAGNEGDSNNRIFYPAACAGALGVAATSWPYDDTASYSNYGEYVGISAPGGDVSLVPLAFWGIWTSMPTESVPLHQYGWEPGQAQFQYQTGTSLACPYVAGLASLYAARHGITQSTPGGVLRLFQALQRGSENVAGLAGWGPNWGWGRIDAQQTLLDVNHRGATVGCLTGQLLYRDTPVENGSIQARVPGTSNVVGAATSRPGGMFRLVNLAPGTYDVYGSYFGENATVANLTVVASADTPRVRINVGSSGANTAPSEPTTVTVSPAAPTSAQSLTGSASGSVDPEGTGVSYEFGWQMRPDESSSWTEGPTGATLPASNTERGQQWRVRARATDGSLFSGWVASSPVSIGNASPTLAAVDIIPPDPDSGDNLIIAPVGAADADGDSISYRYYFEQSPDGGATWTRGPSGRTLSSDLIARGETWRGVCRSYDGVAFSPWTYSDPVTIGNCAPTAPGYARISPANPTTVNSLYATAGEANDIDGDSLTYRYIWFSSPDGVSWTREYTGRVLNSSYTTLGQHWRVRAHAWDGLAQSKPRYSDPVIIGNAPPSKPTSVTISPASPGDDSTLRATATGSVDPEGAAVFYIYRWYSSTDGTTWTRESGGRVLSDLSTTLGEQWKVAARASDGAALSSWTYSGPVTIGGPALAATARSPLQATVAAQSLRSGGAQITVSLTAAATVRAQVRNLAGRLVAVLPEQKAAAGLTTLLWSGLCASGTRAPAGTYLVQVEALSADGTVARSLAPLRQ